MPNIVQNAVGTQRQFTKQPVATYQKNIKNISVNNGLVNTGAGARLHQALMGLGGALMNYAVGEEDRKRADVVRVNRIISSMSDEDMKTLKGMDLLNKYGEHQLADNPYAVAAIEQARGKYFSDKFNQQYSILQAQEPVKTEAEERERYMSEKRKFLADNEGASYNLEGFYNGFWASNLQDVSNISNQKTAEISKSMQAIRDGEVAASFDQLAHDYELAEKQDPDDLFAKTQELMNSARVMEYPQDQRVQIAKNFINQIAKQTGSLDLVNKLTNLVIGTDDNGNEIILKNETAFDDSRTMADQTQLAKPNQYTLDIELKLANCKTKDDVDKLKGSLSKETQNRMDPMFSKRIMEINEEEKQAKRAAELAHQKELNAKKGSTAASIALERSIQGHSDYTFVGTADDAYAAAVAKLQATQPGDTQTFAQVLFWGPNTRMRNEYKSYFTRGLLNMSPSEMADNTNPRSVTNGLALWNYNPAVFASLFGNELAGELQTVQSLINYEGSETAGFETYCRGRDNMARDDSIKEAATTFADTEVKSGDGITLTDANASSTTGTVPINDPVIENVAKNALIYAKASGMSDEAALYQLQNTINSNYVVYDGHPMPKVVFAQKTDSTNGIDASSDQLGAATKYMNYRVAQANAENPGCSFTWWWGTNNKIHFGCQAIGFEEGDGYSLDEFYNNANQWWYDREAEEEKAASAQSSDDNNEDTGVVSVGTRRATYSDLNWDGES